MLQRGPQLAEHQCAPARVFVCRAPVCSSEGLVNKAPVCSSEGLVSRAPVCYSKGLCLQSTSVLQRGPCQQSTVCSSEGLVSRAPVCSSKGLCLQGTSVLQRGPCQQSTSVLQRGPSLQSTSVLQQGPCQQSTSVLQRGPCQQSTSVLQQGPLFAEHQCAPARALLAALRGYRLYRRLGYLFSPDYSRGRYLSTSQAFWTRHSSYSCHPSHFFQQFCLVLNPLHGIPASYYLSYGPPYIIFQGLFRPGLEEPPSGQSHNLLK